MRDLGQGFIDLRPLRQAIYAQFGIDSVKETYPIWNSMNISVKWITEEVKADPSMQYFLSYENMMELFKLPREEFLLKFYNPLQLNRKKVIDKSLSDLDWEIH
jgi:hypothetical protein